MNNMPESMANAMKVAKRIAITMLICVPFMLLFAYLTRSFITSDAAQIVCFILIMGTAVLIEEIVVRKKEKAKKEMNIEKKDVFR